MSGVDHENEKRCVESNQNLSGHGVTLNPLSHTGKALAYL